jgi:hypothetical protein
MVPVIHAPAVAAPQGRRTPAAPSRTRIQAPVSLHGPVFIGGGTSSWQPACARTCLTPLEAGRRAQVMAIAQVIARDFGGRRDLSGLGGVETGRDAAEFLLLGSNSVQARAWAPAATHLISLG